jgi:hypothetical protein
MPKKKMSKVDLLNRRRRKVESDLARYERQMFLYLTKMKKARARWRYYHAAIEKALKEAPKDPTRIVEA